MGFWIHQMHSPRLHCRCPESVQGMPIDQAKWILLFLIPSLPLVQQIWFCSCRMPSPGLLLLRVRWWRKQTEMQAVNLSHYILEHLPLKRLAKGIAVKTKFWLLHGERKFIPVSLASLCIPEGMFVRCLHDPLQQGPILGWDSVFLQQEHRGCLSCMVIYPTPEMAPLPLLVELPFAPFTVFLYKEARGDQPGHCLWLLEMWESYLFLCFLVFVFASHPLLFS